ncbi:Sec63 [Tulasnella sp. 403]|nr:Sec63 [Tulasnella sp. 403]
MYDDEFEALAAEFGLEDDSTAYNQYYTTGQDGYSDPFYENGFGQSSPSPQYSRHPQLFSHQPGPSTHIQSFATQRGQSRPDGRHLGQRMITQAQVPTQYSQRVDQQEFDSYGARAPVPHQPRAYPNYSQFEKKATGIRLIPVSSLPDVYRGIFKFGVFNAIQSQCYDTAVNGEENMVISAPTGSGKTVLFELAIIHLLMGGNKDVKCVYMAPTKALCTERFNDWTNKFQHIGVKCCELTGDTVDTSRNAWKDAKNATIIVTTPEKWDSLTRNWRGHQDILAQMQLFLVDEVHILNESRGSTLEVCISRMKTNGTSVRFVLLSATAPNIEDIANWVGARGSQAGSAHVFKFGEEYRPCKIVRHVYSYPMRNQNPYQFLRGLDFKLFDLLQKHACGKPVLIFCPTRKGVSGTAEQLAKDYKKLVDEKKSLPWILPSRRDASFHDPQLKALLAFGIGMHHAGLALDDRHLTEELYLSGSIRTLVATSTLAVGVNLPAHTVVLKGTRMWSGSGWSEYSDLDVMQMLGRAGRPQFDTEGLAIIMCSTDKEYHYKALTSGKTILESCLHLTLTEHLNSEVGLGTITCLETAKAWLHNSFLFQRLQKNPSHYALGKDQNQSWQQRLDDLVSDAVDSLCSSDLVMATQDQRGRIDTLAATEYGEIMSRYYIRYDTMKAILALPDKATLRDILETISNADEFNDMRLRGSDKQAYNALREHGDIRMSMKKIEKPADKVMLLIQAVLGGISLNAKEFKAAESQPALEALGVFRHATRIAKAIVDTAIAKRCGSQVKYGMELVRSLSAKAWDDRPIVLRQIPQIGEKSLKVLATSGVATIEALRKQPPHRLEMLLNRKPPFGHDILAEVNVLPQYSLKISEESLSPSNGSDPVTVTVLVEVGLAAPLGTGKGKKGPSLGWACIVTLTSDFDFIDFRRLQVKALQEPRSFTVTAQLTKPSQALIEQHAGLTVSHTYKPTLSPTKYPVVKTRPKSELETEIEQLNDMDPTVWVITEEEEQYLTASQPPVLTPTESVPQSQEPMQLPNGRYISSSCKEGALRAPAPKGSRSGKTNAPAAMPKKPKANDEALKPIQPGIKSRNVTMTKSSGKQPTAKVDKTMENLDKLQKATNVNLRLPPGGRLSLGSGAASAWRGSKTSVSEWPAEVTSGRSRHIDPSDVYEPEDELPDPEDVFDSISKGKGKSKGSIELDELDDSDGEMDALLADVSDSVFEHSRSVPMTSQPGVMNDTTSAKRRRDEEIPKEVRFRPAAKKVRVTEHKETRPLFNGFTSSPPKESIPDVYEVKSDDEYADPATELQGLGVEDYYAPEPISFQAEHSAAPAAPYLSPPTFEEWEGRVGGGPEIAESPPTTKGVYDDALDSFFNCQVQESNASGRESGRERALAAMETPSSVHRIKHADNEASFEQMWKDLEGEARLSMCSGALTILVGFYNQGSKTFYKGGRVWSVRFLQRIWDLVQEVEDPGMKLSILQNTATYVNIIKDNIQRFKEENLIANINRIQGLVDDALKNNGSLPMEAILRSPALSSTPTPATSQKPSNTLNSLPPPQPLQDTPTRPPSQQPSKRILTARQAELLALDLDSQLEIINPISPDSLFSSPTHPPLPEPQAPPEPEPEPDVEKTDPFEAPEAGMSHDQDAVASVVLQLLQRVGQAKKLLVA